MTHPAGIATLLYVIVDHNRPPEITASSASYGLRQQVLNDDATDDMSTMQPLYTSTNLSWDLCRKDKLIK